MIRRTLSGPAREALAVVVGEQGATAVAVAVCISPTTVRAALAGHRLNGLTVRALEDYCNATHSAPVARAA
jgi:hypothetical protein